MNNDNSSMICHYNQFSFDRIESFLQCYTSSLHPNHYVLFNALRSLNKLYGNNPPYRIETVSRSPALWKRKLAICQKLLSVDDILEPGLSLSRGSFLLSLKKDNNEFLKFLNPKTDKIIKY